MAPNNILQDVIALIVCSDPIHNAKGAISTRLQTHGARIVPRLGKDVTHIIFERRRSQRACDKRNEDETVAELYRKLEGVSCPPAIVSPLWVEDSITQGRRLVEKRYMVARPKENLLAAAPGSSGPNASGGGTKKRKQRSSGPAPPKPAREFDLDPTDWLFDSTQQLKEPGSGDPASAAPLSGPKRHSRLRRTRSSARASGRLAAAATADVTEPPNAVMRVGTATQAVADILAIDLPADREWSENDEDDLDTPLSVRMARQSSGKRQKVGETGVAVAGKAAGARQSRLARVSKPVVNVEEKKEEAAPAVVEKESEQEEIDEIEDDYDMDVDEALATQVEQVEEEPAASKPPPKQKQKQKQAAPPVAVRFSMRNLHPDRPMLVNKGTPLVPIKAVSTARANGRAQVIPIPGAVRVNSPWNEPTPAPTIAPGKGRRTNLTGSTARPLTLQRPRVSFEGFAAPRTASKLGSGGSDNVSTPTLPTTLKKAIVREAVPTPWSPRHWDGGAAGASTENVDNNVAGGGSVGGSQQTGGKPPSQRRSRFGTQNDEEEAVAAAVTKETGEIEEMATMPEEKQQEHGQEEEEDAVMVEVAGGDDADQMPSFVPASDDEEEDKEQENASENVKKGEKKKRKTTTSQRAAQEVIEVEEEAGHEAEEKEEEETEEKEQGPKHGFIAVTSTSSGVTALCKSAVQRLRGLRLCAEGKEDGAITHLIIGDERRTMKSMLAIANGAILLDPEWITASLEAGKWVPEAPFRSQVRFAAAADRAREHLASSTDTKSKKNGLLSEHAIHIHPGQGNPAALRRVALALGASVTTLKDCSVCVVAGKHGDKPRGVPRQVSVVSEEWLLSAAETFKVPNLKKFSLK